MAGMGTPYPTRSIVTAASTSVLYTDPDVFPYLPGQDFMATKSPGWSTGLKTAASGAEIRVAFQPDPIYTFKVVANVLRDNPSWRALALGSEVQQLLAFYNSRQGRFGCYFYFDPSDNNVPSSSPHAFATGDGTTTTFQVQRFTGYGTPWATLEPVRAFLNNPTVTVNGVAKTLGSDYTANPWGQITFASPPASGAVLRWWGQFLFVCRFDQDNMDLQQITQSLWSQDGLRFKSLRPY